MKSSDLIIEKRIKSKILKVIKKYDGKPMLLVGPSGCGKTTIVNYVANLCKFKVLNIDPNEKYNHYRKTLFNKNQIILLDNLEELSGKKLKEFVNFFIKDGRPLILVCSEINKDLNDIKKKNDIRATNYAFKLEEWSEWLSKKYNLEKKIVDNLISTTQYNKAIALNQLNLNLTDGDLKLTKKLNYNQMFSDAFNKKVDRSEFYYQNNMLPIFMWENYPKMRDNKIEFCNNSAAACGIVDVFEHQISAKQRFEFMPYVAKFTEEMIPWDYDEKIGFARFPSYYGKIKKKSDDLSLEAQLIKKLKKKSKK